MDGNFEFHGDPNVDSDGVIHYLDLQSLPDNGREVPSERHGKFQTLVVTEEVENDSDHDQEVSDAVLSQLDVERIVEQHKHETMEKCDISDQVLSQIDVDKMVKDAGLLPMDNVNHTETPVSDEVIKQKSS